MEIGGVIRLYILHFKKERYYLVYQRADNDYILLNITGTDKRKGIDPEYQHELGRKIDPNYKSIINLNTLVLINNDLFIEMLRKVKQPTKAIKLAEKDFEAIIKGVESCFNNEIFRGNRYRIRVS